MNLIAICFMAALILAGPLCALFVRMVWALKLDLPIYDPVWIARNEFFAETGREPGAKFHACPEWDGLLIDELTPEFEACTCFGAKT